MTCKRAGRKLLLPVGSGHRRSSRVTGVLRFSKEGVAVPLKF